jgi:hypothetical protein
MKKLLLTLSALATFASADTTINATMSLMEKGMNTIQKGFLYNQKAVILEGTDIVISANSIFEKVDTQSFTNGSKATQVISNIHGNLASDLKEFKKAISDNKFSSATDMYGKILNDCVACHTVIRQW